MATLTDDKIRLGHVFRYLLSYVNNLRVDKSLNRFEGERTENSIGHQESFKRDVSDQAILNELTIPLEDLQKKLETKPDGLTNEEAEKRLKKYGPNAFPEKKKSFIKNILVQIKNLFNVLLVVAAVLSFIIGVSTNDAGSIEMGIVILLVVLVSVVFSLLQERHAEKVVEAIGELVPMNAKVMRNGQVKQVEFSKIVPGDVIVLEEGDRVPADARVIVCYELSVDTSTLTGEAEPQPRSSSYEVGAGH
jgi:sodium/potassium-transporting ATPase subunit alpha